MTFLQIIPFFLDKFSKYDGSKYIHLPSMHQKARMNTTSKTWKSQIKQISLKKLYANNTVKVVETKSSKDRNIKKISDSVSF